MKKVLLIEDDEIMRENTAEMLHLASYEVFTADNGKEGVAKAIKEKPDIIICDIAMPGMDGYEVLYLLEKNPATLNIPFIFLTARTEKSDLRKGMAMGADDYLFKPFEEMDLLNSIETRLNKSERINQPFSRDYQGLTEFLKSAKGEEALKHLSEDRKIRKLRKKEIIFMEGDEADYVVFINKGKIKTYNTDREGRELIITFYGAGDFIGYLDLLESKLYRESAEALEESEIISIPKEDFFSLLYSNRDVALRFIQLLSNNMAELKERLHNLAYSSVRRRVADSLLTIGKKYSSASQTKSINISRENLANHVGVTPETLSRTLHDFIDEELIELNNDRNILILNEAKLEKMKN
jgi:CRP/FNR family transcriptional regulator, polysaccharide utilization system transcription regulator